MGSYFILFVLVFKSSMWELWCEQRFIYFENCFAWKIVFWKAVTYFKEIFRFVNRKNSWV